MQRCNGHIDIFAGNQGDSSSAQILGIQIPTRHLSSWPSLPFEKGCCKVVVSRVVSKLCDHLLLAISCVNAFWYIRKVFYSKIVKISLKNSENLLKGASRWHTYCPWFRRQNSSLTSAQCNREMILIVLSPCLMKYLQVESQVKQHRLAGLSLTDYWFHLTSVTEITGFKLGGGEGDLNLRKCASRCG